MHATQPDVQGRMDSIVRVERKTFGATVRGRGHVRDGKPNQDAYRIVADEKNSVYVAVISDGAGSAPNSQQGAQECVNFLAERFLTIGVDLVRGKLHHTHVENKILQAILEHTSNIEAKEGKLRDYHHTLSAVIVTATGGRVIIIGDSPIIVTVHEDSVSLGTDGDLASVFSKAKIFEETKLEYANETHFVTQSVWHNLKISSLPKKFGAIFLMTDGAGAGYISRGAVHEPSMLAMMSEVLASPDIAAKTVEKYLSHPALDEITADDKTFVGIIPSCWINCNIAPNPKNLTPDKNLKNPLSTTALQSKETSESRPLQVPQQAIIEPTTNQSPHLTRPDSSPNIGSSRETQIPLHAGEKNTSPFTQKNIVLGGALVLISVIVSVVSVFCIMHYFAYMADKEKLTAVLAAVPPKAETNQTPTGVTNQQADIVEIIPQAEEGQRGQVGGVTQETTVPASTQPKKNKKAKGGVTQETTVPASIQPKKNQKAKGGVTQETTVPTSIQPKKNQKAKGGVTQETTVPTSPQPNNIQKAKGGVTQETTVPTSTQPNDIQKAKGM